MKSIVVYLYVISQIGMYFYCDYGLNPLIFYYSVIPFYIILFKSLTRDFIVKDNIRSPFKVDLFFYVFFFVLFFFPYQLDLLGFIDARKNAFILESFYLYSNKSIILCAIAIVCFYNGFCLDIKCVKREFCNYKYMPIIVFFLFFFLMALFYFKGFSSMISGSYGGSDTGTNTDNGIYFLVTHFTVISLALVIHQLAKYNGLANFVEWNKLHVVLFFICIIWMLLLLVFGDRNNFLILALVLFGGYYTIISRLKIIYLIFGVIFAFSLYNIVEISRKSENRSISSLIEAVETSNQESKSFEDSSLLNTTVTVRASLYLMDNDYSYFYGKFKAIGLAGIIPYSRGLFVDSNDPLTTSAQALTEGILGSRATWSVGSNLVSDIYMDFGLIGVIMLMWSLGFFAKYIQENFRYNVRSLKWYTIYMATFALYCEMPRYAFDFPVRNIIWTFLLFFVYDFFIRKVKFK